MFILRRLEEGCRGAKKEIGEDYMWVDNGEGEHLAIKYNETNRKYHKINVIVNLFIKHIHIYRGIISRLHADLVVESPFRICKSLGR